MEKSIILNKFWNQLTTEMMDTYVRNRTLYETGNILFNFNAILKVSRPSMTHRQRDALERLLKVHFGADVLSNGSNVVETRFGWLYGILGGLSRKKIIYGLSEMESCIVSWITFRSFIEEMKTKETTTEVKIPQSEGYEDMLMGELSFFRNRNVYRKEYVERISTVYGIDAWIPDEIEDTEVKRIADRISKEYGIEVEIQRDERRFHMRWVL